MKTHNTHVIYLKFIMFHYKIYIVVEEFLKSSLKVL